MKTPRPYQIAAHAAILQKLEVFDSTVAVLFTGGGKTVLAAKLISQWERGSTLFLAHTCELVTQAADKLSVELGYRPPIEMNVSGVDVGDMYGGDMCVVGSVQSMASSKRLAKYRNYPFGLIVIDECHRATSATFRKVINYFRELNPSLKVVGITATPNRADGTAIGTVFDSEAFQMGLLDGIEDGWSVPVEQEYIVCEQVDYGSIKTSGNEFGESDFDANALESIMVEEENLQAVARPLVDKCGSRSALVFCAGVAHANLLASIINRLAGKTVARSISGKTDRKERKRIIDEFHKGEVQFLTNCNVLTEGFDAPNCEVVAMARPTKSLSLYQQMLGRGLRPLPGVVDGVADPFDRKMAILTSAKPHCHVLDFVGNSNHKIASVYDVLGGNYDVEVRKLAEAESRMSKQPVSELLEQARILHELDIQWHKRKHIVANVNYHSHKVDPFSMDSAPGVSKAPKGRGSCSDSQIGLLVKLGVDYETAASYSRKQASAVIDSMRTKKCTANQAKVLEKHGINPHGIGLDRAARILDALAANNWKPLKELPE